MTKLKPRARKIKILAAVAPATRDPDLLRRLVQAGPDAFLAYLQKDNAYQERLMSELGLKGQ